MDAARLPEPRRRILPIRAHDGPGEMAVLDLGDASRPVDLVFVHANGFNARTYRAVIAPLATGLRIVAPDLRGHGLTPLPADPKGRRSWRDHRDDLVGLLEALDGPPVVLSGHSMGGTVALLAAAAAPERVSKVVVFDPVMWGAFGMVMAHLPIVAQRAARRAPWTVQATRRRSVFESREAALKSYLGRGAFKGWTETMVADYVADGFRDLPDGSVELACAPAWEASNYTTHAHNPYAAIRRFGGPVRILKASKGSTTRIKDAEAFSRRHPNATVEKVEGDHFFAMRSPEIVRDALLAATA